MDIQFDIPAAIKELHKFVQPSAVIVVPPVTQQGTPVPSDWEAFMVEQERGHRFSLLSAWEVLTAESAMIHEFLQNAVKRLLVLKELDGAVSLLYAYTVDGSDINFYRGGAPLSRVPERFASIWDRVPLRLRNFYTQLHNGWTFLPGNSMGPLPVEDWSFLTEDKFDIDDETARAVGIDISKLLAVFHNGAGDYLCLNFAEGQSSEASGMIWWHEDPMNPEPVDFWGVLDAWVGIFLEEADRRSDSLQG